jgi:chromosomal replication initiator protein
MDRSPEAVWNACLDVIRDNISRQSFRTWFEPLRAVSLEDDGGLQKLTVQLPSRFYYEWLEEHYFALLRKTIAKVLGPDGRLFYDIVIERDEPDHAGASMHLPARSAGAAQAPAPDLVGTDGPTLAPAGRAPAVATPGAARGDGGGTPFGPMMPVPSVPTAPPGTSPFVVPGIRRAEVAPHLNPQYTFERYIEGDCNRLARSAATAIANAPGTTAFNPFLVYGGVGLGKTHLIQAIGNFARSGGRAEAVRYVSSEQFTGEFVSAIQNNRIGEFSQFYRNIDLLIVDDIQFFGGKEKTQEEFFHIFNTLHQNRKQIVLSADRPPKEIAGIEERLLSRFGWGLIADVQPPELETRIAILRRRAEDDGTHIQDDVLDYVAHNVTSNIRELEGALIRLQAHAALQNRDIDVDLAREVLRDLIKEVRTTLSVEEIQRVVCEYLRIPEDLVRARTRKREVVQARQIAMYFAKGLTKHSLKTIGLHFGGRDHSTVIHAVQSVEDQVDTDPQFRETVEAIRRKLDLHAR